MGIGNLADLFSRFVPVWGWIGGAEGLYAGAGWLLAACRRGTLPRARPGQGLAVCRRGTLPRARPGEGVGGDRQGGGAVGCGL